jgi:hypothetical protein
MKKLSQMAFLICFLTVVGFATSCLATQSLPDGWWLQDSPEKILAMAQATNDGLAFFMEKNLALHFHKIQILLPRPMTMPAWNFFREEMPIDSWRQKGFNWMGISNGRITNSKVAITFSHMDS